MDLTREQLREAEKTGLENSALMLSGQLRGLEMVLEMEQE